MPAVDDAPERLDDDPEKTADKEHPEQLIEGDPLRKMLALLFLQVDLGIGGRRREEARPDLHSGLVVVRLPQPGLDFVGKSGAAAVDFLMELPRLFQGLGLLLEGDAELGVFGKPAAGVQRKLVKLACDNAGRIVFQHPELVFK